MLNRVFIVLFLLFPALTPSYAQGELPGKSSLKGDITILEDSKYFDVLLSRINDAGKDILISMYVFKTTDRNTNPANMIKDALIRAAHRGVRVKVLLEKEDGEGGTINSDNEHTAEMLRKGGVTVYFDSPWKRTHAKAIVIDKRYTFIGSHNLTSSALGHNKELSLLIDSEDVADRTGKYIEEMMKRAGGR